MLTGSPEPFAKRLAAALADAAGRYWAELKERLGDRFRELDVPLLLEWPDGRRAAVLFAFEEESETSRFSIHRLAHYCPESCRFV